MRDCIALIADVVTIVGILALLTFLLNHPVTRRLGVWAGSLRDPYGYGCKRRQRGWRRKWRVVVDRFLSPLSKIGSETRQPMKPDAGHGGLFLERAAPQASPAQMHRLREQARPPMILVRMSGMNRGDCLLSTFAFQPLLRSVSQGQVDRSWERHQTPVFA